MENQEWLAQAFEAQRPHLQAVAYRLLGSLAEANDAVQQTPQRLIAAVFVRPEAIMTLLQVRRATGRHDGE